MTEFVETIWDDNNIKVVIEEILRNQKDLSNYAADVEKMMEISEKLNDISQKYNKSYDSKSDSSHTMCSSECLHEGTWGDKRISKTQKNNKKTTNLKQEKTKGKNKVKKSKHKGKKKKEKPILVNGKPLNDMETDELINYINGNGNNQKSSKKAHKIVQKSVPTAMISTNNSEDLTENSEIIEEKELNENDVVEFKKRIQTSNYFGSRLVCWNASDNYKYKNNIFQNIFDLNSVHS